MSKTDEAVAAAQSALERIRDAKDLPEARMTLAHTLWERYQEAAEPADLDRAIELLDLPGGTSASVSLQRDVNSTLTTMLMARWERAGRDEDLRRAEVAAEAAARAAKSLGGDVGWYWRQVGDVRLERYHMSWRPEDARDAVAAFEAAVAATPAPPRGRKRRKDPAAEEAYFTRLLALGRALRLAYEASHEVPLMDRAVRALSRGAAVARGPAKARLLNALGTALQDRWQTVQTVGDLDAAVAAHEQALAELAPERPVGFLADLANALRQRHTARLMRADLYRALDLYEETVSAIPGGLEEANTRLLNHFGLALAQRYDQEGEREYLDRAIVLHRQALERTPPNYPDRIIFACNLARELGGRTWGTAGRGDIDEAIGLLRQVRDAVPDDPGVALDLAGLLHHRYVIGREDTDRLAALGLVEELLVALPEGHPDKDHLRRRAAAYRVPVVETEGPWETPDDGRLVTVFRGEYGGRPRTLALVVPAADPLVLTGLGEDPDTRFFMDMMAAVEGAGPPQDDDIWIAVAQLSQSGRERDYAIYSYRTEPGLAGQALAAAILTYLGTETEPPPTARDVRLDGPFRAKRGGPVAYVLHATIDRHPWQFVLALSDERPPAALDRMGELSARFAAEARADYETAARINAWIVTEEGRLLPYHQQPGASTKELALDAMAALTRPFRLDGPYRLSGLDYKAYMLTGHFAGAVRRTCFVAPEAEDTSALTEATAWRLFLALLGEVPSTQTEWPADRIWADVPTTTPGTWSTFPVSPISADPRENAEAVLFLYGTEYLRNRAVAVPEWALGRNLRGLAGEYGMQAFYVQVEDGLPSSLVLAKSLDFDAIGHGEAIQYLREATSHIENRNFMMAFRSFAYYRYLGHAGRDREELDAAVATGIYLAGQLIEDRKFDYAEWVAKWTATLAERSGNHDDARTAHWHAAMACEYLGWMDDAMNHYTAALGNLAPYQDTRLESQLNMSAGVTIITAFSDYEPERRYVDPMDAGSRALVERALVYLDRAREMYATRDTERDRRSLRTIEIYRWRAIDLLGEHEAATSRLAELRTVPETAQDEPLRQTADWFMLAALRKAAYAEPTLLGQFTKSAYAYFERTQGYREISAAKSIPMLAMMGDDACAVGEHGVAFHLYRYAREAQQAGYAQLVRPPRPGDAHGGWGEIEILGRMTREAAAHPGVLGERPLEVLLEIENAKSRWFLRDLAIGLPHRPPAARLSATDERARLPAEALADPRIDLAERLWRGESGDPQGMVNETAVGELWQRLPAGAAVVSFYATRHETFVSVLRAPDHPPTVLRLPVTTERLERITTRMQAHFSGAGLYGAIDPRDPGRHHDRFIGALDQLAEQLAPLVAQLENSELVVALPHRQWHNLPVHAMLLPRLWRRGSRAGWIYAPSLGLLDFLLRRTAARGSKPFVRAGVTTAPMPGDDVEAFEIAHNNLVRQLGRSFDTVKETFGDQSTVNAFHDASGSVALYHLLAHGSFRAGTDVMRSGFALTSGVLTGQDLIARGTTARHVTVQACSLGRSVAAASDEMWGPTRALLAAGADAVLAPLWNVDLASSTMLLDNFYTTWLEQGVPKWRALAIAQNAMWRGIYEAEWRHMYHWSAFKLIGI